MRTQLITASVLLALVCAACGGGRGRTDTGQPGSDGQGATELAILDRFKTLDDEVEKSRGQCPRLATSIGSWLDGNSGELSALIEKSRAEPGLEGDHLERIEEHLARIFERVLDAVTTCKGQGGVDQAYAKLDAWLETT